MSNETATAPGDPLEPIKRVTRTETELATEVTRLRASVKGQLETIQRDGESLLLATRADAERERETTLATARRDGDREAEQILAEGTARAKAIHGKSAAELAAQREAILAAVLADLRSTGGRSGA